MKTGTKSLLWGTHQFLWHPLTVLGAWWRLYGSFPKWWECVAIFCHDLGYWGCPDMDGPEGRQHPEAGALLTRSIVWHLTFAGLQVRGAFDSDFNLMAAYSVAEIRGHQAMELALGHSRHYAAMAGTPTSKLYLADKKSFLLEPRWFYLLRAKASGELWEYVYDSPGGPNQTPEEWHAYYSDYVRNL